MVTQVRDDGVHIRYWPLHLFWHRKISSEKIADCERVTENFVTGYGIHTDGISWAYNVRGHEFVRLKLTNRKDVVIGTQRPEELVRAIEEVWERPAKGGMNGPTDPV